MEWSNPQLQQKQGREKTVGQRVVKINRKMMKHETNHNTVDASQLATYAPLQVLYRNHVTHFVVSHGPVPLNSKAQTLHGLHLLLYIVHMYKYILSTYRYSY